MEADGMSNTSTSARVTLMTADETANFLGLSKSTLAKWRMTGLDGPAFIKLGAKVVYDRAVVEEWIESRRRRSTSENRAA